MVLVRNAKTDGCRVGVPVADRVVGAHGQHELLKTSPPCDVRMPATSSVPAQADADRGERPGVLTTEERAELTRFRPAHRRMKVELKFLL
jgi:hypothetical protein